MQHLVRSASLLRYDEFARRFGLDPEEMLRRAGIPLQCLAESDLFFPYEDLVELLDSSARLGNNPFFGAELGMLQGLDVLGPIAYLVRSSATVSDALAGLARYFHLHNAGASIRLEIHGNAGLIAYDMHVRTSAPTRHAVELAVAIGYKMLRILVGERLQIRECVFRHDAQADPRAYRRIFGTRPRFNGEYDGYTVDARLLELPLSGADHSLNELMRRQLTAQAASFQDALPARVEAEIRGALPIGEVSLEYIARRLATSGRSLQRSLQQEGVSFQVLLDGVRRNIAEHYLRDSTLPLTQIAQLLAYGDLSILTRAFQRWHNTSPRSWRAMHRQARNAHGANAPTSDT